MAISVIYKRPCYRGPCLGCEHIRKTDTRETNIYYCNEGVKMAHIKSNPVPAFGCHIFDKKIMEVKNNG